MSDFADTTRVAQALSRAIDEYQELKAEGLYLDDGPDHENSTVRIEEASAELFNSKIMPLSAFKIHTSDGQVWDVTVQPAKHRN
jgi:hypothetical protein